MTKRGFTFMFVCLFAGIALFGTLSMVHMESHSGAPCLPAPMGSTVCLTGVTHVVSHLNVFQQLGTATFSVSLTQLLTVLALLFLAGSVFRSGAWFTQASFVRNRMHVRETDEHPSHITWMRWFARLEHSPTM